MQRVPHCLRFYITIIYLMLKQSTFYPSLHAQIPCPTPSDITKRTNQRPPPCRFIHGCGPPCGSLARHPSASCILLVGALDLHDTIHWYDLCRGTRPLPNHHASN